MRVAWFLILSLWAAAAAAQTTYKCTDDRRRVTYSNTPCEKQGLKDAGPVAERTTSMPFTAQPKPAPRTDPAPRTEPSPTKPVNPLIEKLVK